MSDKLKENTWTQFRCTFILYRQGRYKSKWSALSCHEPFLYNAPFHRSWRVTDWFNEYKNDVNNCHLYEINGLISKGKSVVVFNPSRSYTETCRINILAQLSCSVGVWWPSTSLRQFMVGFPLICHPYVRVGEKKNEATTWGWECSAVETCRILLEKTVGWTCFCVSTVNFPK